MELIIQEWVKHPQDFHHYYNPLTSGVILSRNDNSERIVLTEEYFNSMMKGIHQLTVWDNQRSGRSKTFGFDIPWIKEKEENPYKPSYDNLLENSKATREAIEEKKREYKELAQRVISTRFRGEKERYEYKYPFEDQHIEELRQEKDEQKYGLIPFLLGKIAKSFGLLKQETPSKKGNFRIVDFHNEELGKANNLYDAIFIFKQTYKYCRDEDALPFIYEDSIENKPSIIDEDGRLVGYWIKEKE